MDENWNSAYPYAVGPTFYGNWARRNVTSITETVEVYTKDTTTSLNYQGIELKTNFSIFPNPAQDFVAVQASGLVDNNIELELVTLKGEVIRSSTLKQGSTIWYIDTKTIYNGQYLLRIVQGQYVSIKKIIIQK